jgi:hypothetical protein
MLNKNAGAMKKKGVGRVEQQETQQGGSPNTPVRVSDPWVRFYLKLLTVIAIIAVLVALLLVDNPDAGGPTDEGNTLNDIRQLTISVYNFKQKFGILPPSKITLCGNSGLLQNKDPASYAYLNVFWPRLDWTGGSGPLDWSGTGQTDTLFVLEGDQCLVFFLGGIPSHDVNDPKLLRCEGFSLRHHSRPNEFGALESGLAWESSPSVPSSPNRSNKPCSRWLGLLIACWPMI